MRGKKAFLSLITNVVREGISILCGFILPHIIISSFGTEVYGLTESIKGFLSFIVLLEAGFGPVVKVALYKALAKKDSNGIKRILKASEKFFRRIAIVFLIYVLGLAFIYPMLSDTQLDYAFVVTLILVMSIGTFAEYFFGMTYRLFLQSDQKSYIINIIQIVTLLLSLGLAVLSIKLGTSIIWVEIAIGFIYMLRPLTQTIYIRKKYKLNLSGVDSNFKVKQKWDALTHHIAFMIHSRADIVVLTLLASLKDVAIYSVYNLVLNGIKSFVNIVAESFSAAFGDMIAKKEDDLLRRKFGAYETIYMTLSTIVYSCTIMLITPFVTVYTLKIGDTDYMQPLFGILLTISTYLLTIRQPYNELVKVAGHFRQTRRGAVVEALINVIISVILVWRFGLVGVAIGTLVATLIRSVEFIYHTNRFILNRSVLVSIKKIMFLIIETLLIVLFAHFIPMPSMDSYLNWIMYAIEVFVIAVFVVLSINCLLYKNDFKELGRTVKKLLRLKRRTP